jgi:hypothetical protein
VTFIKIRSHRRKFSNSDSVEQKKTFSITIPFEIISLVYIRMLLTKAFDFIVIEN